MARRPTYAEMQDRVTELEEENQALNDKLDSISDIVGEEDEEDEDEDEDLD
jgi:cell shape-determining protein MreC